MISQFTALMAEEAAKARPKEGRKPSLEVKDDRSSSYSTANEDVQVSSKCYTISLLLSCL